MVQPSPHTFHPEKEVFCLHLPRIYTHTPMHRHACENTDEACSQQRHSTHTHSEKTSHIGQKKRNKKRQDPSQCCAPRRNTAVVARPLGGTEARCGAACTSPLPPPPSPLHVLISALVPLRRRPRRMPCLAPRRASIGPTAVPKLTMKHAAAKPCCLCTLRGGEKKKKKKLLTR